MATATDPMLDQWYSHIDKGEQFQVVAIDEDSADVEIQYLDGTLDGIGREDWAELDLDLIEPPANMADPLDIAEKEDMGYQTSDLEPDGNGPASGFDAETAAEENMREGETASARHDAGSSSRSPIDQLDIRRNQWIQWVF